MQPQKEAESWESKGIPLSRFPSSTLLPFFWGVPLLKPNSRRKGTLIIKGLLGNLAPEFRVPIWEFPKIRGTLFWCPYNKGPTIYRGYDMRVPYFRKPPQKGSLNTYHRGLNTYYRGLNNDLYYLFSGLPYYNYSILVPENPIVIIKAPIMLKPRCSKP